MTLAFSCKVVTKNYENPSIFVKVTAKKSVAPFFIDTVYITCVYKTSVSTVSHNNPIWQTIPSIHYSISKIEIAQVIFKTSFENSQIITPGCLDASCFQMWHHICIIFPRNCLISFYHISSYPPIMQGWHITRFQAIFVREVFQCRYQFSCSRSTEF